MEEAEDKLFTLLPSAETGILFENNLIEQPGQNILDYLYYYNGGGVAAGDFNGDSLPDLYFVSNQGENRLYFNRGTFKFEDASETSGTAGSGDWSTGVTVADVNGDGWLDIYVCYVSGHNNFTGRNQLFINNGDETFRERAAEYGLDIQSYATQAAFFDYDLDGDLDMYLLNHSVHNKGTYGPANVRNQSDPDAGDRLMRNDGGTFSDVTFESGIFSSKLGYGLDLAISDIDRNGYPDVLVSNDFHENDYMYLNNGDGTFTDHLVAQFRHTSRFSMGNDVADVNNDGLVDAVILDMLPENERILKTSEGAESSTIYETKISLGYHHQVSRNTLQINTGSSFSESAYMAGISATDWSWSALIADFDLDGMKDLYITNGIYRRPNDSDFVRYVSNEEAQRVLASGEGIEAILNKMPTVELTNFMFRNVGFNDTLWGFENVTEKWGLAHPGYSNGAVYVDLDNDGDLDIVTNNIASQAFIYRNNAERLFDHNSLQVELIGADQVTTSGASVFVYHQDNMQMMENTFARGMMSATTDVLNFGLGQSTVADSVVVWWPGGTQSVAYNVSANKPVVFRTSERTERNYISDGYTGRWMNEAQERGLDFVHQENAYVDFNVEFLIPHKLSTQGPALAVGDLNGDGTDDIFVGGASGQMAETYIQRNGRFRKLYQEDLAADDEHEDVDVALLDADDDGDLDAFVVSGGNNINKQHLLSDRLYLNDGRGNMRTSRWVPALDINSGAVAAADFDGDGNTDVFVGGRSIPGAYGIAPASALLRNTGSGFEEVTAQFAPSLMHPGMIADACWLDYDEDGDPDLFIVGEWMSPRLYENQGGMLVDRTEHAGLANYSGWWNSLDVLDVNNDGRKDLLAGNLGKNSFLQASRSRPATLYVADFDGNGQSDPIISTSRNGVDYPIANRDEIIRQMATMKKRFPDYASYGEVTTQTLFEEGVLESAVKKDATTFESGVFVSNPNGTFDFLALPNPSQLSPVHAGLAIGDTLVLTAGNFFGASPYFGRYDASNGSLSKMTDDGLMSVNSAKIGVFLPAEVRDLVRITVEGKPYILVGVNNGPLELYNLSVE